MDLNVRTAGTIQRAIERYALEDETIDFASSIAVKEITKEDEEGMTHTSQIILTVISLRMKSIVPNRWARVGFTIDEVDPDAATLDTAILRAIDSLRGQLAYAA